MKDMIQNSVSESLMKRKEERKSKKRDNSSDGGGRDQKLQFMQEKVDEF